MTAPPATSARPITRIPEIGHWIRLHSMGTPVYNTEARPERCGDKTAWDVAGVLLSRFRDIVPILDNITRNDENSDIFKVPRYRKFWRGKGDKPVPTYNLFFLSRTPSWDASRLTLVAQCEDITFAQNAIKKFRIHPTIRTFQEELGFGYLAWTKVVQLYTGERLESGAAVATNWSESEFRSLCGSRIVITQRPTRSDSSFASATLGGVFMIGGKYYGLTAAHAFDNIDKGDQDDLSQRSASDDNNEGRNSSPMSLDETPLEEQQSLDLWSQENDIYLPHHLDTRNILSRIGYLELNEQNETPWFSLDLDWALFEIVDPRFFLPNSMPLLGASTFLADFDNVSTSPPLPGERVTIIHGSGLRTETSCTGSVTGITFPWSLHVQQVWEVRSECCNGDCGAWVVDPVNGSIVGMVVAGTPGQPCTYVIPAAEIVQAIQSRRSPQILRAGDMNPVVPAKGRIAKKAELSEAPGALSIIMGQGDDGSPASFLLTNWLRGIPVPARGLTDRDSALGSDMVHLSNQETRLADILHRMDPLLAEFAQIPEQDFGASVSFLAKHPGIFAEHQVELLLEKAVEICKGVNLHSARSMVHQAALLHMRLIFDDDGFGNFQRPLIQEDWIPTASWFSEISDYWQNLLTVVSKQPNVRLGEYSALVFGAVRSTSPTSAPKRDTGIETEMVDKRYYVRSNSRVFFEPGRVFAMLWTSESIQLLPALAPGGHGPTSSQSYLRYMVRNMVVLERKTTSVDCLPISTYGGRGVSKRGFSVFDQRNHAIIYATGSQIVRVAGEEAMTLTPIAFDSYKSRMLDPMSRINFGIVRQIPFDLKVMNLGKVHISSLTDFKRNWRTVRDRVQDTLQEAPISY